MGFRFNVRNFAFTLAPMLAPNSYHFQVFLLLLIFVSWLCVQMYTQAWRFSVLNCFDTITSAMHILMLNLFSTLVVTTLQDSHTQETIVKDIGYVIALALMINITLLFSVGTTKVAIKFLAQKSYALFITHPKVVADNM